MYSGRDVTVVIPNYNSEDYLLETIGSVYQQTTNVGAVLVVDDCSSDGSLEVLKLLTGRYESLRVVPLDRNYGGPARARNLGVNLTQTSLVALLDSDDIWHPQKLELQLKVFNEHNSKLLSTRLVNFEDAPPPYFFDKSKVHEIPVSFVDYGAQLRKYRTGTSSLLALTELMLAFPFDEDPSIAGREDLKQSLKLHAAIDYSIKVDMPLVAYRVHKNQISKSKFKMLKIQYGIIQKSLEGRGRLVSAQAIFYFCTSLVLSLLRVVTRTL